MASVRVAVKTEAQHLALAADGIAPGGDEGHLVPEPVVERLHAVARASERPAETLRWAWRAQHTVYMCSRTRRDGLASMYLLGALLHAEQVADVPVAVTG